MGDEELQSPRARTVKGISLVPQGRCTELSHQQLVDVVTLLESFTEWSLHLGKKPRHAEGYATATVENRVHRLHDFFEYVFEAEDGYTTTFTHDHADGYMRHLAFGERSDADKANHEKAIKCFYKWLHHERGHEQWETDYSFATTGSDTAQRDFLTREERDRLRDAALSYDSLPSYNAVTPEQRRRVTRYLAQRYGKPMEEVGPTDWDRADGFKYPSLVYVSLDCGLRPVEVERATVDWLDLDRGQLVVPKTGSRKDESPWRVGLTERTVRMCKHWLEQRATIPQYDDTDALWLTDRGNRYGSQALSYVLENLFEEAGIDPRNRTVSWYLIRRSTATYLIDESDLSTAKNQLRHKNLETTLRYDQAPQKRVRDSLDSI